MSANRYPIEASWWDGFHSGYGGQFLLGTPDTTKVLLPELELGFEH